MAAFKELMDPTSSGYTYETKEKDDGEKSAHFFSVFEIYDCSFNFYLKLCPRFPSSSWACSLFRFQREAWTSAWRGHATPWNNAFPWILKIFLAIFSDDVTCCGSRRKSYLIINSTFNIFQ